MPIVEYPFTTLSPGASPRPMLPIRIHNPDTGLIYRTWGLIDTGADDCAIPAAVAPVIGHQLNAGNPSSIGTAGGNATVYAHITRIDILSITDHVTVVHSIQNTPVDFCPGLNTVMLGVANFLSNFVLTIDYPRQRFSIKTP